MLSTGNKNGLIASVKNQREECLAKGPEGTIEHILQYSMARIDANPKFRATPGFRASIENDLRNMRENRKEAETFVAGLLGLLH